VYSEGHFLKFPIVFKPTGKKKRKVKEKIAKLRKIDLDFGITLKQMTTDGKIFKIF